MDFAQKIRSSVNVPLMLTGGFKSWAGMNEAIQSGDVDLIGLAIFFESSKEGFDTLNFDYGIVYSGFCPRFICRHHADFKAVAHQSKHSFVQGFQG